MTFKEGPLEPIDMKKELSITSTANFQDVLAHGAIAWAVEWLETAKDDPQYNNTATWLAERYGELVEALRRAGRTEEAAKYEIMQKNEREKGSGQ